MTPPSVEELISAYLDGELDEAERGRVERLLARSEEYRRVLAEMRMIRKLLDGLPKQTPSPALEHRVTSYAQQQGLPLQSPLSLPSGTTAVPPPAAEAIHLISRGNSEGRLYLQHRRKQRARWMFASAAATAAALLLLAWIGPDWMASRTVSQAVDSDGAPEERPPSAVDSPMPVTGFDGGETLDASKVPRQAPPAIPPSDARQLSNAAGQTQLPATEPPAPRWSELPPIDASGFRVYNARDAMQEQQPSRLQIEPSGETQELPQAMRRIARPSPFADVPPTSGEVILLIDQNQDGLVTDIEAQQGLELFRQQSTSRRRTVDGQRLLGHLDQNEDGRISDEEIRDAIASARRRVPGAGRHVASLLASLDRDANGRIESDELQALVEGLGAVGKRLEPQLPSLLIHVDQNRDGQIDAFESQLHADAIATVLGLQLPAAEAAPGPLALTYRVYNQLDRNHDGQLSRREAERGSQLSIPFDAADTDRDGLVMAGEYLDTLLDRFAAPAEERTFRFRF